MTLRKFVLKVCRRLYRTLSVWSRDRFLQGQQYVGYVELSGQDANDYLLNALLQGKPLMVSKFGTNELTALVQYYYAHKSHYTWRDYVAYVRGQVPLDDAIDLGHLCSDAGFFPNDATLLSRYYEENLAAMQCIDVLGSYMQAEGLFDAYLTHACRVNLDGYYAPFYYKHPWTKALRGKRVLVVHPFAEDIKRQYARRQLLWDDAEVLPEFTLLTYKAVQSMLGIETGYPTWFDALQKMKDDISRIDFDVALIGCGAYGMPLAAHCKQMGRQSVHLAGWTQVLFGIIGTRWENNPRVASYMNAYWTRPSSDNTPREARKVENACYW